MFVGVHDKNLDFDPPRHSQIGSKWRAIWPPPGASEAVQEAGARRVKKSMLLIFLMFNLRTSVKNLLILDCEGYSLLILIFLKEKLKVFT